MTIQLHAVRSFLCLKKKGKISLNLSTPTTRPYLKFISHYLYGIINFLKVNEAVAQGLLPPSVIHHADVRQWPILREDFSEILLCGVEAQAKHSQAGV